METYYVTQEQLELLEGLKEREQLYTLHELLSLEGAYKVGVSVPKVEEEGKLLRYLGGDETINFKAKETLYRLWRINNADNKIYMEFNLGTPDWTFYEEYAFTAPLDEIKKWKTPAWEIEKAD